MAKYELNHLPREGIFQNNPTFLMWIVHIVLPKRFRSVLHGLLRTILLVCPVIDTPVEIIV